MYRLILPLVLCACVVRSAPQHNQPAGVTGSEEGYGAVTAGAPETESDELVRRARQDSATAAPGEADTAVTEAEVTRRAFTRAPRPARPRARFTSKLSYFNRANAPGGGDGETNLLEKPYSYEYKGYRKFTSSCRCEKIWNCPRLQVTVPRCPDEFFLCCDL